MITSKLPKSILSIINRIKETHDLDSTTASEIISNAAVSPDELAPWTSFDHSAKDSYGRKLVCDYGNFEIMVMSWIPGDMSMIHDHGYTQWGAVQLFGIAEHAVFEISNGILTTTERKLCKKRQILSVENSLIHQMGNVGDTNYLTLHLYGSSNRKEDVTADARIFELDNNKIQVVNGGVFFALNDSEVSDSTEEIHADFPTTLRYKTELLKRLQKINSSGLGNNETRKREDKLSNALFEKLTWKKLSDELEGNQPTSYLDILEKELKVVSEVQNMLINSSRFKHLKEQYSEISKMVNKNFLSNYLRLIGDTFGISKFSGYNILNS